MYQATHLEPLFSAALLPQLLRLLLLLLVWVWCGGGGVVVKPGPKRRCNHRLGPFVRKPIKISI